MSEANVAGDQAQAGPKHALRRTLFGRPRTGQTPVKVLIQQHRAN